MPREHGFNKPCYWLILTKSLIPRNSLWLVYDLSDLETSMNIRNKIDQEIKIYVSPSRISIIHQSWNYSFYYLFITLHLFIISLSLSRSSSRFNHASKISSFHAFSKFLNVPYMNIYIYSTRFPFSTVQFIHRSRKSSLYADRYAGVPGDERTSETVSIR